MLGHIVAGLMSMKLENSESVTYWCFVGTAREDEAELLRTPFTDQSIGNIGQVNC